MPAAPTSAIRSTISDVSSVPPAHTRTVVSPVLGDLTLAAEQIIAFPEGLHGFPSEREFALVAATRDGFYWLQSTAEAGLVFLLADPFRVSEGYDVNLSAGDEAFLALSSPEQALVLTVVTMPASTSGTATTNLRAPIVFNLAARRARQIVRTDDRYELQEPISV